MGLAALVEAVINWKLSKEQSQDGEIIKEKRSYGKKMKQQAFY